MAEIGGFRSNLSITCKTDRNFRNVPRVFRFPKSRIKENGGNTRRQMNHCNNKSNQQNVMKLLNQNSGAIEMR